MEELRSKDIEESSCEIYLKFMFTPSAASNSEEVTVSRDQKDQKVSNSEKISLRKASKGLQEEWKISLCLFVFYFFFFSFLGGGL